MKDPVRVAVTGAAGQIGYALLFRIASGQMLGHDQPVILQMLEITPGLRRAAGRVHGARRLRLPAAGRTCRPTTPTRAFDDVDFALLVGAMPRKAGMERADLLVRQRRHLHRQGKALVRDARRRREGAGRRQPRQHQLPDRHRQRPSVPDPSASPP